MGSETTNSWLNGIPTQWTVVCEAVAGPAEGVQQAQQELWHRYGKAVHRYLLGALHDADAAAELTQQFALAFLSGNLGRADRERGRFRDFIKGVLCRLIADHYRRKQRQPLQMPDGGPEAAAVDEGTAEADRQFLESWRDELLDRAWKALKAWEERAGSPFYAVLRVRVEHPDLRSGDLAERLGAQRGEPVTADWVRQNLRRARDRFAQLLVEEVTQTLKSPTQEQLEQELIDLGLLEYCKPALARFANRS